MRILMIHAAEFSFRVTEGGRVDLMIFSARGELVRTLVSDALPPGGYRVSWDGRDAAGRPASSGTYFYRLTAGDLRQTRKMVLIR